LTASTKGEQSVKILAKFLLSSVFFFLPAVVFAQVAHGLHSDCGFAPALKIYTTDLNGRVSSEIVEMLEDGQNCLNGNLMELKESVESLHTQTRWNADDVKDLRDKLEQAEHDLHTAETKVETLEDRLSTAENEIEELKLHFQAITRAFAAELKKGNAKVFTALADRAYGKPRQQIEFAGEDGGPIQTNIVVQFVRTHDEEKVQ
jgi:septal ring factor EnvC (AmiA/AmiB activator)